MAAEPDGSRAYGLVKTPAVQAMLAREPTERRARLEDALAGLCAEPRPPESRPSPLRLRGHSAHELRVEAGLPDYLVLYVIDEAAAKVTVVAVERVFA